MILADDDGARRDAEASAGVARMAALTVGERRDCLAELARHPGAALMLEAQAMGDADLTALLAQLRDDSGMPRFPIVVAFEPEQTDIVAHALLGTEAQLLCRPTLADRVAALVLARTRATGGMSDPMSEEAQRLSVIAEEVARIAEALGEASRRRVVDRMPVADRRLAFVPPPEEAASPVTAAQIRGAIRSRRLRDAEFGAGLFEEPAWDMLLDLFAAELEGTRVSVSSLCIAAAVAQTTALRWITKMLAIGLLERNDDMADRRRAFVTLSARSSAGLKRYYAAVQRAGLGIA